MQLTDAGRIHRTLAGCLGKEIVEPADARDGMAGIAAREQFRFELRVALELPFAKPQSGAVRVLWVGRG